MLSPSRLKAWERAGSPDPILLLDKAIVNMSLLIKCMIKDVDDGDVFQSGNVVFNFIHYPSWDG
eukprot:8761489-Ditylum_brightwellii.AAC.1